MGFKQFKFWWTDFCFLWRGRVLMNRWSLRASLDSLFPSLNFHHSSLITHHSSLNFSHSFGIITQFPSLNIFHTICGSIPVSRYIFFLVPKLTKKKSQSGQKLRLVLFMGPSYVFNYKNAIELWVMETENSQNVFLVSITHNSKIRKLSNGNRVIVCQTTFLLWIPPFFSYELWKLKTPFDCFQFP